MIGSLSWQNSDWTICLQVLAERPRRRQLQRLPQEVILIFALSDTLLQAVIRQAMACLITA
jgi:hypothetical protein